MRVTYGPGQTSWSNICMHAPVKYFQNAPAHFTAVSYARKMFMKSTPVVAASSPALVPFLWRRRRQCRRTDGKCRRRLVFVIHRKV